MSAPAGTTPSQTVGPFFRFGFEWLIPTELVDPKRPDAVVLAGQVLDGAGQPVPDAVVEVWQADGAGRFPGDPGVADGWNGFGRCLTDADGRWRFVTVKPGTVDAADGRPQAPHVDLSVFARGLLNRLVTRVYFPDEAEANSGDPVLSSIADPAARTSLVAAPDGDGLRFDVHLQGAAETVFFSW